VLFAAFAEGIKLKSALKKRETAPQIDFCKPCIDFMNEAIEELLQAIGNQGLPEGCTALCALTGSPVMAVCEVLCLIVGMQEFVNLINQTDPDPIFICEELKVCPIHDNGTAAITEFQVTPAKGEQGATFTIALQFKVTAQTGTGEVAFFILPPGNSTVLQAITPNEGFAPGQYSAGLPFQTTPSEQESWPVGIYQVVAEICNGSCGSKHAHAKLLATAQTQFGITN